MCRTSSRLLTRKQECPMALVIQEAQTHVKPSIPNEFVWRANHAPCIQLVMQERRWYTQYDAVFSFTRIKYVHAHNYISWTSLHVPTNLIQCIPNSLVRFRALMHQWQRILTSAVRIDSIHFYLTALELDHIFFAERYFANVEYSALQTWSMNHDWWISDTATVDSLLTHTCLWTPRQQLCDSVQIIICTEYPEWLLHCPKILESYWLRVGRNDKSFSCSSI